MMSETYGVIVLKLEFWITTIILLGGGALMWHDQTFMTPVFAIWAMVIGFWFNRRSSETTASNLMTAMQTQPPITLQPTVIPQQPTAVPIAEQPKESRAPDESK